MRIIIILVLLLTIPSVHAEIQPLSLQELAGQVTGDIDLLTGEDYFDVGIEWERITIPYPDGTSEEHICPLGAAEEETCSGMISPFTLHITIYEQERPTYIHTKGMYSKGGAYQAFYLEERESLGGPGYTQGAHTIKIEHLPAEEFYAIENVALWICSQYTREEMEEIITSDRERQIVDDYFEGQEQTWICGFKGLTDKIDGDNWRIQEFTMGRNEFLPQSNSASSRSTTTGGRTGSRNVCNNIPLNQQFCNGDFASSRTWLSECVIDENGDKVEKIVDNCGNVNDGVTHAGVSGICWSGDHPGKLGPSECVPYYWRPYCPFGNTTYCVEGEWRQRYIGIAMFTPTRDYYYIAQECIRERPSFWDPNLNALPLEDCLFWKTRVTCEPNQGLILEGENSYCICGENREWNAATQNCECPEGTQESIRGTCIDVNEDGSWKQCISGQGMCDDGDPCTKDLCYCSSPNGCGENSEDGCVHYWKRDNPECLERAKIP